MSTPYLTRSELIARSMIASSTVMGMTVTPAERAMADSLDRRVVERILAERPILSTNVFWCAGFVSREAFAAGRIAILANLGQVERAIAFLVLCCGRHKTLNRRITS